MSINRRDFLRNSSFAAIGLSVPFLSKANFLDAAAGLKIPNFGIQLWTVKENMMEDAKGTLAKLASLGTNKLKVTKDRRVCFGVWVTKVLKATSMI